MTDQRVNATIERLISNIPAACKVLEEQGHHNLAGQLRRDCNNLAYWQKRGLMQTMIARGLRIAVVQQQYNAGNLTEGEARELLSRPLTPGDITTIVDDSDQLVV